MPECTEEHEGSDKLNTRPEKAQVSVALNVQPQHNKKRKRVGGNVFAEDDPESSESGSPKEATGGTSETKVEENPDSKKSPPSTASRPNDESTQSADESSSGDDVRQPKGWRVKLYRLNPDGSWADCGTGRIVCTHRESPTSPQLLSAAKNLDQWVAAQTGEATLIVQGEISQHHPKPRILLRTSILLREAYQRQGENIITWCEPRYKAGTSESSPIEANNDEDDGSSGVDLALSFQDNEGCLEIWKQITQIQNKAAALQSVEVAAKVSAQHHADLQHESDDQHAVAVAAAAAMVDFSARFPNPPKLSDLDGIGDAIAALQHVQQREALASWIAQEECMYLKKLLECFPEAEAQNDYGKLATLAACVKTILLLNDPSLLELIVSDSSVFEKICACLEYDPDLREKANHRWFLREKAKFRTVVRVRNPNLVASIHRSFRVQYLRDSLLRPTMDEASLSTLTSLQTFIHADVVKRVTLNDGEDASSRGSYLLQVIRVLGVELHAIGVAEWNAETEHQVESSSGTIAGEELVLDGSEVVTGDAAMKHLPWRQYLSPQDSSIASRRIRRRGCLSFLRELFNMVRLSLQPSDKDNFFGVICSLELDLLEEREIPDTASQASQQVEVGSVTSTAASTVKSETERDTHSVDLGSLQSPTNLLSLLANVLSDPYVQVSEKALCLEIIIGVAMHDPRLIRRHCLDYHTVWNNHEKARPNVTISRPEPNDRKQVLFACPPNDLLGALLFLLDVETDVGVLLQVSEILRVVLDTEMVGDQGPVNAFSDENTLTSTNGNAHPPANTNGHETSPVQPEQPTSSSDQKQFLSLFFDNYVEWLVAPFQFSIVHSVRRIPDNVLRNQSESPLLLRMHRSFQEGVTADSTLFKIVRPCAIRSSFAVELLSFCVRAHLHRMKFFLLRTSVLGNVLQVLRPRNRVLSGDRCLKLAALRFLRAVLSINDEFYNRHVVQHNHFEPVFEAFRSNPVGDNLVSSAIVEICDFVHSENIKVLLEHIVTKHMVPESEDENSLSIEDVSSPYVSTLTVLRKSYEELQRSTSEDLENSQHRENQHRLLSAKAIEDQRKFREMDESESYFDSDESEPAPSTTPTPRTSVPPAVDEVEQVESELHRTPRMFSLAQAPLLNNLEDSSETNRASEETQDD